MADLVIVTGTDPASRHGGIGFALPGYLRALDIAGIQWISIPTYHPTEWGGRWRLWVKAFPRLISTIHRQKNRGGQTLVYSHAGAGISLLREFFILLMARVLGAKTVLQLHTMRVSDYLEHPLQKWLFRLAIIPAQSLGVLTPWWHRYLESRGISKWKFLIPNPMPTEWERIARMPFDRKIKENRIRLLTLTRLVPGKGVDLVIEAMPSLPSEYQLVVAGDGSMRTSLERRIEELGLGERAHMMGWVSGEEKQRLFDESDIFVLPSRMDSFGMGYLEAMANGLPVVAADWGPIPDVVPQGECGILVDEDTPEALASGILGLRDTTRRRDMGKRAKRWVLERFSGEVVARQLEGMVRGMLE